MGEKLPPDRGGPSAKAGDQRVMATVKHNARVVSDEGDSVGVKITKHSITTPTTEDADVIWVNATQEQGHSTARTKRAGCNIGRVDASTIREGEGRCPKNARDHR